MLEKNLENKNEVQNYRRFIEELIEGYMQVLGPRVAVDTANTVAGFSCDQSGKVISLPEDPVGSCKNIFLAFRALSEAAAEAVFCKLLERELYADIARELEQPSARLQLHCHEIHLLEEAQ